MIQDMLDVSVANFSLMNVSGLRISTFLPFACGWTINQLLRICLASVVGSYLVTGISAPNIVAKIQSL